MSSPPQKVNAWGVIDVLINSVGGVFHSIYIYQIMSYTKVKKWKLLNCIFRESSQPRDQTQVSHTAGRFTKYFTILIVNFASTKMKNVLKLFAEFINIKQLSFSPLIHQ